MLPQAPTPPQPQAETWRTTDPVVDLLVSGAAATVHEAEAMYLDANLAEVVRLVTSPLSDDEFRRHPLIALLLSHGSRPREDAVS